MRPICGAAAQTIHEFMLVAARLRPNQPAVVERAPDGIPRIVTYRELEQRTGDYAAALDDLGVGIGDRVVLESDNSACAIAMLLACSTVGATFVPVSPTMPTPRLLAITSSVEPVLHLQPDLGGRADLPDPIGLARFGPDGVTVCRAPLRRGRSWRAAASTDAAYMIFTSGTTGRPKGVVMSHRAVLAFYRALLDADIARETDRIATTSPLQFDFSLLDIGLALGAGAALVPVPRDVLNWPRKLVRFLADAEVTQVNGVPSIWRSVLRHEPNGLAALAHRVRGVLFAGESFPLPELRRLQTLLPAARMVNCFGWTESMASSLTDVPNPLPADVETLSIGFAYQGAEMMLVDDTGAAVHEPGVVGEIHMRGPSLFTGYWADEKATSAALVSDPLDPRSAQRVYRSGDLAYRGRRGELYFAGRADLQVQIRGYRVELGEIERRLVEFPGVAEATVVVRPHEDGPEPVACVVLAAGVESVDEAEVSLFCEQTLPSYMVPRTVIVIEGTPVTPNGKTDRAALLTLLADIGPLETVRVRR
jgi:amino acid adenylation domain-containing protein